MNVTEKEQRIAHWLETNGEVQMMVADYMATVKPLTMAAFIATQDCNTSSPDGFEGVLTRDGRWYPLRGSHSLMLNWLAAEELGTDVSTYLKSVPHVCYTAMTEYAMKISKAMTVRPMLQQYADEMTQEQADALQELEDAGLITLHAESVRTSPRIKAQFNKLVHRQMDVLLTK